MTVPVFYFCTISVLQIFLFGETQGRRICSRTVRLETRMLHQRDEAEIIEGFGIYSGHCYVWFLQLTEATTTKHIKVKSFKIQLQKLIIFFIMYTQKKGNIEFRKVIENKMTHC